MVVELATDVLRDVRLDGVEVTAEVLGGGIEGPGRGIRSPTGRGVPVRGFEAPLVIIRNLGGGLADFFLGVGSLKDRLDGIDVDLVISVVGQFEGGKSRWAR